MNRYHSRFVGIFRRITIELRPSVVPDLGIVCYLVCLLLLIRGRNVTIAARENELRRGKDRPT